MPTLYEQVFFQQEGFALLMLWVERAEDEDKERDEDEVKATVSESPGRWQPLVTSQPTIKPTSFLYLSLTEWLARHGVLQVVKEGAPPKIRHH